MDKKTRLSLLGYEATLTVAASDAIARVRAKADYICDGTDDDIQIQTAIDALPAAGGLVTLSEGNFVVGSVIDLVSNSGIRGLGNSTIITAVNGFGLQSVLRANAVTDVVMRDLQIDGNIIGNPRSGDPDNQNGVEINGSDRFWLENLYIHDTPDNAIGVMHDCSGGFINGNRTISPGWHGIMLWDDVHNVVVKGNYVRGATNNVGIVAEKTAGLDPSTYNIISNNIVEACYRGIVDIDSNFVNISHNIIYDGTLRSIEIVTSEQDVIGVNIVGNVMHNQSGENVITFATPTGDLVQDCIVADNIIYGCVNYAMFIGKSYRVLICNNIMTGNAGGIRFTGAGHDSVSIIGNISDNTNWDIFDLMGSNHYITDNSFLSPNKIHGVLASATIKDNIGYVSENEGAAANINDGGTIAHGLSGTPSVAVASPSVASEIVSVTGLGAANITVAIKEDDGTPGTQQTIYWRAWL